MVSQVNHSTAPGLGIASIPRTLWEFPRNPIDFCTELFEKYGDIVHFQIGPYPVYLITNPEYIKHVLQDNNKNYSKGRIYAAFKPVVGDGLLTAEGEAWRHHRRLANPSFQHSHVHGFVPMFVKQAQHLLADWETHVQKHDTFDLAKDMMRLTFGVVGQALFSMDIEQDAHEVGEAITIALAEASKRADMLIPIPMWLPTASNQQYKDALDTLNSNVMKIIHERQSMSDRPSDLLSDLIDAVDEETKEHMTDEELRDDVMTFMLAGHETTANALTWTWYLLSEHPEAEERVRSECAKVVGDRVPTFKDLESLSYTKMVFQEAMRIYPPFPFIARSSLEPDQIGGYDIPANAIVMMSQYLMHRHPKFWDNPESFDPERFRPEAIRERPHLCYFPFGGGQRMCIGADFATQEAQVFLCMAVQKYHLQRASTEPVELLEQVTLRPRDGMPMKITQV